MVPRSRLGSNLQNRPSEPAWLQHSRSGHLPYGGQSQKKCAEQMVSEPRYQEPFRRGWSKLRHSWMAEPNYDNSGALYASVRVFGGTDAHEQCLVKLLQILAFSNSRYPAQVYIRL